SFGAAPALVMYEWVLRDLGKLGWIAAFVYVAGAALRLARFNTLLEVADKRYFMGLPSPSAAALVAGLVWVVDDLGYDPDALRWLAWAVTLFAGFVVYAISGYVVSGWMLVRARHMRTAGLQIPPEVLTLSIFQFKDEAE